MRAPAKLCSLLRIEHPLLGAPMAGGPSTPALAAEVSRAGGLGFLACAYSTPEQILEWSREVRARTDRPFGINLFADVPEGPAVDPGPILELLRPIHAELGLPPPEPPAPSTRSLDAQIEAVAESGAAVFSVTFGIPSAAQLERVRRAGLVRVATANTVEEARRIEAAGFQAVVAQGSEAGGHRATFVGSFERGLVGTMALVPQVADAVRIPVVAAGGIMDGRGWVAAEALGAAGVQLGTAFLASDECGAIPAYKEAVLAATDDGTVITRAFSGRAARGLVNRFLTEAEERPETILPYPLQNALTRPMRAAASRAGRAELLSLWAGQAARLARRGPAAEIVRWLVADAARVRALLAG
ncbi:MAG TPA: nitronate monooxygenase [Myxococcaceae bacterium]|nr:nitronate monooxygenase [Myxococcaceae bacterium]